MKVTLIGRQMIVDIRIEIVIHTDSRVDLRSLMGENAKNNTEGRNSHHTVLVLDTENRNRSGGGEERPRAIFEDPCEKERDDQLT